MFNVKEKILKVSVKESIEYLLKKAEMEKSKKMSKKYVRMAWELVKKNKVRLTMPQKLKFCKKCFSIWVPGETATILFDKKNNLFRIKCKCGHSKTVGSKKDKK